ncbi:MAG: tRNA (cytidine(34)-2'-O)-methyltransferase [Alphaproteobacteria bacterium]|nr:tRNA (cytidine(34)-2'-O)-methyltransferase [Alphaproteobacteria bacterium]
MIDVALYQPDIPQNVGAAIRLCACMEAGLHIIEPCSFPWDERKIKQAAMDYMSKVKIRRYSSWNAFCEAQAERRIVLMTTKGSVPYTDFTFKDGDILLAGSESSGAPENVHERADGRVLIPMAEGLRSLNVVNASAMILGEALRQTKWKAG